MKRLRKPDRILIIVIIGMIVAGCVLPARQVVSNQSIDDIILQTAAAAQTLTVTNLPSPTPTQTVTITPTPSIPSVTPSATFPFGIFVEAPLDAIIETPNQEIIGSSSSTDTNGVKIKYSDELWSCVIVGKSPSKNSTVSQGQNFYVSWILVNNGTKTWTRNGVDFVYDSGFRHEGGPIQDMAKTILPGGQITLKVLIITPKKDDTYNVIWSLKVGNFKFCHMKVTFEVKK